MVIPSPEYDAWMSWVFLTTFKIWAAGLLVIALGLLVERLPKWWARVALAVVVGAVVAGAFAVTQAAVLTPCVVCNMDVWPVFCWIWWC